MLCTEIIAVFSKIHPTHTNTPYGQNTEFLNVKVSGVKLSLWKVILLQSYSTVYYSFFFIFYFFIFFLTIFSAPCLSDAVYRCWNCLHILQLCAVYLARYEFLNLVWTASILMICSLLLLQWQIMWQEFHV